MVRKLSDSILRYLVRVNPMGLSRGSVFSLRAVATVSPWIRSLWLRCCNQILFFVYMSKFFNNFSYTKLLHCYINIDYLYSYFYKSICRIYGSLSNDNRKLDNSFKVLVTVDNFFKFIKFSVTIVMHGYAVVWFL